VLGAYTAGWISTFMRYRFSRQNPSASRAQRADNHPRRRRLVQSVEVDARSAAPQKLYALHRRVCHPELRHGSRVILDFFQVHRKAIGTRRAKQSDEAVDLLDIGDRHDARHDGNVDSDPPGPLDKVEIEGVVEKELSDDEIQSGIDFLLEVSQILVARGRLDVP